MKSTERAKQPVSSSSTPITLRFGKRLAIRLYASSLPNYLEVAPLHKGLILVLDDKELVEEGIGFGVPVVKCLNNTFFSGSAQCYIQEDDNNCILIKSFVLDSISRKRVWKASYINDKLYRFFHKLFERFYLSHKGLSPIFVRIIQLRKIIRVETEFIKVKPQGIITFRYLCQPNVIQIQTDLSKFTLAGCQEILILNEQGASFFRRYSDSDRLNLTDEKIGAWEKVGAKEASLSDMKKTLQFTLNASDLGLMFRGRENVKGRFCWSGLSYSLEPGRLFFDYSIKLRLSEKT